MITIIENIDLIDDIDKYDVILVGTNTYHTMGNGFQRKVRVHYPTTYILNTATKYGDIKKLGSRISTTGTPIFSLCFITHGYNFRPDLMPDYLNYEALENCIRTANIEYDGLNVATTMIGCSNFDGNGDRDKVIEILNRNSDRMKLTIYDYVQLDRDDESVMKYKSISMNENYDKATKVELFTKKIEEEKKLSFMDNPTKRLNRIKDDIKKLLNDK
jgi:hypothetical protein